MRWLNEAFVAFGEDVYFRVYFIVDFVVIVLKFVDVGF